MPHQTFVEHVIAAWYTLEAESPHLGITSAVKRLPDGSKGAIEIESPTHLALIEVWEHANCLDTTILRAGEQRGVILAAGSCITRIESIERLRSFRAALAEDSHA